MRKKLITKPPKPNPKCCKTCLVRPCCSIDEWNECPEAWAEIMKVGSFVYWPHPFNTREGLIEEGYSDEDADLLSSLSKIIGDIRKGDLTIRPATRRDRNVVKFVITEYR
jgi:hypothetical protein